MSGNVSEKQWYIVNTYSSHERKVKANLERAIQSLGLQDKIFRVEVVEQEVPVIKDGIDTGKTKTKNLFPGYIFVEMIMTDDTWYYVRNTEGVTGITGSSGGGQKPTPVPREQMEPILKRFFGEVEPDMYANYKVGDRVKINQGSFEGCEGTIEKIEKNKLEDKEVITVTVEFMYFGNLQHVDFDFVEIEKING